MEVKGDLVSEAVLISFRLRVHREWVIKLALSLSEVVIMVVQAAKYISDAKLRLEIYECVTRTTI